MEHEKIIKDSRGTVAIVVKLWVGDHWGKDANGNQYRYDVTTWIIEPGKRKKIYGSGIATGEEIQAAKLEIWNKIKP